MIYLLSFWSGLVVGIGEAASLLVNDFGEKKVDVAAALNLEPGYC